MELLSLIQELAACHGPAGDERGVREAIRTLAAPYGDECYTDALGNLIVHKRGDGPKVLFAAHMDTIGLIVTHVEEDGFLRVGKLGGVRLEGLSHTAVRFANGVRGTVAADEKADPKKPKLEEFYIDIGARSREQAQRAADIGDTAVFDAPTFQACGRIISPHLDNRISCAVLLLVLFRMKRSRNDLYFVFTSQEELGLRGARTAAYAIDPDYAIAVDVTLSDDLPESKHNGSSVLGKGAAIKVMDGSVIAHPEMVERLEKLAVSSKIPYQRDVIRAGGTDAGAIHISRMGVCTGGLSIPCRYLHSPAEMIDPVDAYACADLAEAFAMSRLEQI